MTPSIELGQFEAVLFDLDGVLTTARAMHAAAWKRTIDEFLLAWDARHGVTTARFDTSSDYETHVDGKLRHDGVRDFSRLAGSSCPKVIRSRNRGEESVWGLGNRKQLYVEEELERQASKCSRGRSPGFGNYARLGSRPPSCRAAGTARPSSNPQGSPSCSTCASTVRRSCGCDLSDKPAPDAFLEAAAGSGCTTASGRGRGLHRRGCGRSSGWLRTGRRR